MTITANCIAASITRHPEDKGIASVLCHYPRFIHAELMTHRVFSRNASSSRAIPVKRMIADIRRDPAMPIHWGANQPGMQASTELSPFWRFIVRNLWLAGMWIMTTIALVAARCGAHKQIVNRLVEPWAHITVLITSTEWDNFFELRCHPDAQPEIQDLANKIRAAVTSATFVILGPGELHVPFVHTVWDSRGDFLMRGDQKCFDGFKNDGYRVAGPDTTEFKWLSFNEALKVSTARAARTSYLTHDGKTPTLGADLKLYQQLVGARPLHASPAEHQAWPADDPASNSLNGNFSKFWVQHRKVLEQTVLA